MDKDERVRLNLAVSPQVKSRLERLQQLSDAASVTEVIRRGLAYYEELLTVSAEGGKVILETPTGDRERLRVV